MDLELTGKAAIVTGASRGAGKAIARCLRTPYLWPVAALALVLAIRILAPSDVGGHDDQAKTMAFTADMVLNGEWILPRDGRGLRSMKPPLVNWIGALLPALGIWGEWALKLPSMLGVTLAVGVTVWMTRRMMLDVAGGTSGAGARPGAGAPWAAAVGAAAGVLFVAGEDTIKHAYFLRPDMLSAGLLSVAWALGTVALGRETARPRLTALAFWLVVAAAFLTKGFTALIPVLYVFLAARLVHGRWSVADRVGWRWGLPLALAAFATWVVLAYRVIPDHVTHSLIGVETVDRVTGRLSLVGWLGHCLLGSWKVPVWMSSRFYPWATVAVVALVPIGMRGWFRHPMAPAVLWVLAVVAVFLPVQGVRPSYVLPAYPAIAGLTAYALVTGIGRVRLSPAGVAAAGAFMILVLGMLQVTLFEGPFGDNMKAFVRAARPLVGRDPVVFLDVRDLALITLLGRHQAGPPPAEAVAAATWIIRPVDDGQGAAVGAKPTLTSGPVRGLRGRRVALGLYRHDTATATTGPPPR